MEPEEVVILEHLPKLMDFIIPLSLFIGCNVVGVMVSNVVFLRLGRLLQATLGLYYEVIVKAFRGMPIIWGLMLGSYAAIHIIDLNVYWLTILKTFFVTVSIASTTIIVARMFSGIVKSYAVKREGIFPTASILGNLVEISIYLVGVLILLQNFGVSITPILTALGVGGLAVALALQDTLSNLFSGLHLLLSRQIKVGDYVKLNTGEEGNVVDISWRNTTIQELGNNMIIVPNQKIASAIITNYYIPNREISVSVLSRVSYASDLERVEKITIEVAKEVMASMQGSVENFQPVVRFHTFGDASIQFNVVLRAKEFADQYILKHQFIKSLHMRYRQEGIEVPLPISIVYSEQMR